MTSVISRGPTPVSSQLSIAAEAIAHTQQPTTLSDRFDGVVSGRRFKRRLPAVPHPATSNSTLRRRHSFRLRWRQSPLGYQCGCYCSCRRNTCQGITTYNDVNALVQQVLREAYLQNTEDLRMFAEKVKFFNAVKETLRNELSRAREALTSAIEANPGVGSDEQMSLREPFLPRMLIRRFGVARMCQLQMHTKLSMVALQMQPSRLASLVEIGRR